MSGYPPNQWNLGLPGGSSNAQQAQPQNAAMMQGLNMTNPFNGPVGGNSPQLAQAQAQHFRSQTAPQAYAPQQNVGMSYGSPQIPQQMLGGVQQSMPPRSASPQIQGHARAVTTGQIAASMLPQQPPPQRPSTQININSLLSTPQGRATLATMLNKSGGSNSPILAGCTPQQVAAIVNQLTRPTAAPQVMQNMQHPHPLPMQSAQVGQNFNFAQAGLVNFPSPPITSSPPVGSVNLPRPPMGHQGSFGATGNLTPRTHSPSAFSTPLPTSASSPAASSPKSTAPPRKRKAPASNSGRDGKSPSGSAAASPATVPSPLPNPAQTSSTTPGFVPSVLTAPGTPATPMPRPPPPSTPSVLLAPGAQTPGTPATRPTAPDHPSVGRSPSFTTPQSQITGMRPPVRPPQTVFFAGQPPAPRDRDVDREAAMEREKERIRALRAKENEHGSRKRDSMRGQMRNEVARLMYAAGDVVEPDQNSVDYMEDLLVEFVSDLCRPVAPIRPNPQSARQAVQLTPAIIRSRLHAPNPLLRKYAERFDYMTHMSSTLAEAKRVDMPTHEDLVKTVGSSFLGLEEGGEQRKIGRPRKNKKPKEDEGPKEKKRPGPRKGWKNDNEALERVRQKKEVKKGKEKEKIKARLAVKSEAA